MYAALGLLRAGWAVDIVPIHQPQHSGNDAAADHPVQHDLEHAFRVLRPGADAVSIFGRLVRRHGFAAFRTIDPTRFARSTFTLKPLFLAGTLSRGGPYDVVHPR